MTLRTTHYFAFILGFPLGALILISIGLDKKWISADEGQMHASMIGALLGAMVGLLVLTRQREMTDERHVNTVRSLCNVLRAAAQQMQVEQYSTAWGGCFRARNALKALERVSLALQAEGPNLAQVAQLVQADVVAEELDRICASGGAVASDILLRGREIEALCESIDRMLAKGP